MPLAPLKDPWQQVPIVEDGEEVRSDIFIANTGCSIWIVVMFSGLQNESRRTSL